MTRSVRTLVALALTVVLAPLAVAVMAEGLAAQEASDPGRLYGRVTTPDGSVYEGYIRWDGNEAGWFDILTVDKRIPAANRRDAERLGARAGSGEKRIEVFGIGITLEPDRAVVSRTAQSGIRFGHISTLEPTGRNRARVLLKSGQELELPSGGDIGEGVDGIVVEDRRLGQVELDWRDIRSVDFMGGPGAPSRWGDRLYGTLRTRDGETFTGYLVWDMDEVFTTDVLDGEDRGRDLEIPFGRIERIEREGSRAARVTVTSGDEVVLRGTNDVNDGNRDILVSDPTLGEVRVEWDELDRVDFTRPPAAADLGMFDGGHALEGTVYARDGESYTGRIRWDNDEEQSWEVLDGDLRDGVSLDVELGAVATIERASYRSARVTLWDGRSFELTGSNDVDDGNRGVYVERASGEVVLVPWERFERVEFRPAR